MFKKILGSLSFIFLLTSPQAVYAEPVATCHTPESIKVPEDIYNKVTFALGDESTHAFKSASFEYAFFKCKYDNNLTLFARIDPRSYKTNTCKFADGKTSCTNAAGVQCVLSCDPQ
jgi:hypothetical protein